MEFYQVINNRRTVRELRAEPVPTDVLQRIIAAGIQAPTYNHGREFAAAAEGLACSMRIPVGDEGLKVAEAVHAQEGYMLPCYIGLGYPVENAAVVEQVERPVKSTLHFGTW